MLNRMTALTLPFKVVVALAVIIVAYGAANDVRAADDNATDIDTVIVRGSTYIRQLRSVSFTSNNSYRGVSRRYEFSAQNGKYREEIEVNGGLGGSMVIAYDGHNYQNYRPKSKALAIAKSPEGRQSQCDDNPLLSLYSWLIFPKSHLTWLDIQDPVNWEKLRGNARVVGSSVENGRNALICEVGERPKHFFEVYFGADVHYLPLKVIEYIDGDEVGKSVLESWRELGGDGARIAIPTHVTVSGAPHHGLPASLRVMEVDRETLSANQPLDESIFTISQTKARMVGSYDTGEATYPLSPKKVPIKTRQPSDPYLLMLVIGVIILVAIAFWRRRHWLRTKGP